MFKNTVKPLTREQADTLVNLILAALAECSVMTPGAIEAFAIRNRKRKADWDAGLTVGQIHRNLPLFLAKLTSGGRIGVLYCRR